MSLSRLPMIQTWLQEQQLDAYLVTSPFNRTYMSGWLDDDTESFSSLLIGRDAHYLLTNNLYAEIAEKEAEGWPVITPPARDYASKIAELAVQHGWKQLGFETAQITFEKHQQITTALNLHAIAFIPFAESCIEQARSVKSSEEIALIQHASDITDQTFEYLCSWIQVGMTEKQVEWEIYRKMAELGADGPSFQAIVASGPNSSQPHARPGNRQIQAGEFITIDMGAKYKGYCADMTRTICLGEPAEPRMVEIYNAVLNSLHTCEEQIGPNTGAKQADTITRDVLKAAGLDQYYVHSAGHAVGLAVHEEPGLNQRQPDNLLLRPGNIVTVEPGVYIPGWGGVRVEDCVLITESGRTIMNHAHKELVIQR